MLPGPAKILSCPFCGAKKEIMSLLSGNTINGIVWSDTRRHYPMLPEVSPIQCCPECGKYYFIDQAQPTFDEQKYSFERGKLGYLGIKEAMMQMSKQTLSPIQRWKLNHEFFLIYNDCFRRYPERTAFPPAEDDEAMFEQVINDLLVGTEDSEEYDLFRAELFRESGRFTEASAVLSTHLAEDDRWVVIAMQEHIAQGDALPFLLIKDGKPVC